MQAFEREMDSIGEYVAEVVHAATNLAERAVVSADRLAMQAVRDAGKVAEAFEELTWVALRSTLDFAQEVVDAVLAGDDDRAERRGDDS
jgi:predicted dinucleotide-binding enzyme